MIQRHKSRIDIHTKCPAYSRINDTWSYFSPCEVSPGMHMHAYMQAPHKFSYFYLYTSEFTFLLTLLPAQNPASPAQLLPAQGNKSTHLYAPFAFLIHEIQMLNRTQLCGDAGLRYTAVTPLKDLPYVWRSAFSPIHRFLLLLAHCDISSILLLPHPSKWKTKFGEKRKNKVVCLLQPHSYSIGERKVSVAVLQHLHERWASLV